MCVAEAGVLLLASDVFDGVLADALELAEGRALADVAAEVEALGEAFGVELVDAVLLGVAVAFGVVLGLTVAETLGLALIEAVALGEADIAGDALALVDAAEPVL